MLNWLFNLVETFEATPTIVAPALVPIVPYVAPIVQAVPPTPASISASNSLTQGGFPVCNITVNGEMYYSKNPLGAVGGVIGGFLGTLFNGLLFCIFLIVYAFSQNTVILFFVICTFLGICYSIYEARSSISTASSQANQSRPCINNNGVVLK
jgi:hypothetical protein